VSVEDTVLGMWKALSARNWEELKTFLAEDCLYLDMPVGPAAAAKGPEDIVKRLKIGLEPLASYQNFVVGVRRLRGGLVGRYRVILQL
jgi:hypothetical protein